MPLRRKREKFQQITEFERERIIGLQNGGLYYCVIAACVQQNTAIRIWKQWTDEHRTIGKTGSFRADDGR